MSSADKILAQVRRRYARATFYRDRGSVRLSQVDKTETTRAAFRTTFSRFRRFLFEFQVTAGHGVVGKQCSLLVEHDRVIEVRGLSAPSRSIGGNVVCMAGITFGAAHIIPRMLLINGIPGPMICAASGAELRGIREVDGQECVVIDVPDATATSLVVDTTALTLRGVVSANNVTPRLRAMARAYGVDADALPSVFTTLWYDPELDTEGETGAELDRQDWLDL